MWRNISLDKCLSFIKSRYGPKATTAETPTRPAVTISRMSGSGGHTVAFCLADYLQMGVPTHEPWTVFDQNLVEQVLKDHHIQKHIARFMEEVRQGVCNWGW